MDRSKIIFNNPIDTKDYQKAEKSKQKYLKKFGDDKDVLYPLFVEENKTLSSLLGIQNIVTKETGQKINSENSLIIGNIRMGFGHYRISIAIASAAHSMGITPYWFDLHSYQETTGGKIIKHLNNLYSMGSRWSQKYSLFNKYYWEPLNSEGFRQLSYNSVDQKVSECMTPIYREIPHTMPFVATHVWPAQAAVHAGMNRVINVIPDNWPMALHLAEGSIHTVQTPSSYLGYRSLRGMAKEKTLNPIPSDQLFDVGHYIDHELLVNLESDCQKRLDRIENNQSKRVLLTVGGAGAQKEIFSQIVRSLLPRVKNKEVTLLINVGDHIKVWEGLCEDIPNLKDLTETHFNAWDETQHFSKSLENNTVYGIHAFYHEDIFAAVYSTNLLMPNTDILITKPSELAFYPVPKLMIKRVGGHEAWGAIRAQEVGDGTYECETVQSTLQMLELMLEDKAILSSFSLNIIKAYRMGIYDGAYKVVRMAIENNQ